MRPQNPCSRIDQKQNLLPDRFHDKESVGCRGGNKTEGTQIVNVIAAIIMDRKMNLYKVCFRLICTMLLETVIPKFFTHLILLHKECVASKRTCYRLTYRKREEYKGKDA